MKKLKRFFSFLIVFSMIISVLPKYTYAQETKVKVEENVKTNAENFIANVNEEAISQGDRVKIPIDVESEDNENVERYVVLIIDSSEKMKGKPFELEKQTALKFCKSVLSAKGENHVSIVGMSKFEFPPLYFYTHKICHFTEDIEYLERSINSLKEQTGFNDIYHALLEAGKILDTAGKDFYEEGHFNIKDPATTFGNEKPKKNKKIVKDIVLLSNGVPTRGKDPIILEDAPIPELHMMEFSKNAEEIALKLKETGVKIHTLGFYQNLSPVKIIDADKLMKNIANGGYSYIVDDVDKIDFVFGGEDTDPIIIIPGIMGSRLYNSEQRIWEPDKNNIDDVSSNITGELNVNGISIQQNKSSNAREYGAKSSYKNIVDDLCRRFPTRPVYFFNYDWRKSNSNSAEKLNLAINKILAETKKKKVDIVAHSMGGLVTSSYFSKYGNEKIDKVITCGTPYEGSGKVFNVIMNWDLLGENPLSSFVDIIDGILGLCGFSKDIKSSFLGVTELTPTENYLNKIKMFKANYKKFYYDNTKMTNSEYEKVCKYLFGEKNFKSAKYFQNSILENGYNNLLNYKNAYFLIGVNHKTITSVSFDYDLNKENPDSLYERYYETDLGYETKGDRTVPFYSSSISEQILNLEAKRWVAFTADHGEVKDLPKCINWICDILSNGVSPIKSDILKSEPYVVVRIACPVDVTTIKNGELLSSDVKNLKINSDYGRLDILGKNDEIKMLCLDEDENIKIKLNGTDTGTMDYTIRYFDENNNLVDERNFKDVPVTKDTLIDTGIDKGNETVLNIDQDGDGKVDKTISASKNETVNKDGTPFILTKNIKLNSPKTELKVGESVDLSISVEPKEANDNLKIIFKSSDEKIATVDENGRVKALSVGKVKITVETENGVFKSSVELNIVKDKENLIDENQNKNEGKQEDLDNKVIKDKKYVKDNKDDNIVKQKDKVEEVQTDLNKDNKKNKQSLVKTGLTNSKVLILISILSGLLVIYIFRKNKNSLIKHK